MFHLQLHFSLSLSFMFLCLLLFTIKVSQGKFFSVLLAPHALCQLPTDSSECLAGRSHLGLTLAGAAHSQPKSTMCLCLCMSTCLCVCPVAAQPWECVLCPVLKCPLGTLRAGKGPGFSLKTIRRPPSAVNPALVGPAVHSLLSFCLSFLCSVKCTG